MPGFHHSVAVLPLPFPYTVAVAVAYLFAVYGCNGTEFSYRTTEFYNGITAKRQRKNGNRMVETGHYCLNVRYCSTTK